MQRLARRQPARHECGDGRRAGSVHGEGNHEVGVEDDGHYGVCRCAASVRPSRITATASTDR